jgi:adenosylmethionine---8-amino-7-oxononanoate aminotransferase
MSQLRPCGRSASFLPCAVFSSADLIRFDKAHFWHPFTPMGEWCAPEHEPLIIVSGEGAMVRDQHGREYLDGNSTIWTNIHGHRHPKITEAIIEQLGRIAHVSALGLTNEPAIRLAKELIGLWPHSELTRVFFSDDGSTAIECAMKMAIQFRQLSGEPERCGFIGFDQAYHGDTMGAASLGGVAAFHDRFRRLGMPVCFVRSMEELRGIDAAGCAAVVIEPLIQGAAGMKMWPRGMLRELRAWCHERDVFLIADEVMTGFGRTGKMFACEHENVAPDFVALAKGLTGGTLPLGATLTTERVFRAFLGDPDEMKTFFHGHSYTGNPLGCAAALANIEIFREEGVLAGLEAKIALVTELLAGLRAGHPGLIGDIRQCGFIAGIDLMADAANSTPFPATVRAGERVCFAARRHGLLTRPIRDTIVLMPPLCTTASQLRSAANALDAAIGEVCGAEQWPV